MVPNRIWMNFGIIRGKKRRHSPAIWVCFCWEQKEQQQKSIFNDVEIQKSPNYPTGLP